MREFGAGQPDDRDSSAGPGFWFYWLFAGSVIAWTLWCAADLFITYYWLLDREPFRPLWEFSEDKAEARQLVFFGYASVRAFWWFIFAGPLALVALLIKPRR